MEREREKNEKGGDKQRKEEKKEEARGEKDSLPSDSEFDREREKEEGEREGEGEGGRGSLPLRRKRSSTVNDDDKIIDCGTPLPTDSLKTTPVSLSPTDFDPSHFDPSGSVSRASSSSITLTTAFSSSSERDEAQLTPRTLASLSSTSSSSSLEGRLQVRFPSLTALTQRTSSGMRTDFSPRSQQTPSNKNPVLKKMESKEAFPFLVVRRGGSSTGLLKTPPSKSPPHIRGSPTLAESDDDDTVDMSRIFHNLVTPRPKRKIRRAKDDSRMGSAPSTEPSEDDVDQEQEEYIHVEVFRDILTGSGLHPNFIDRAIAFFDKDGDHKISCEELLRIEGMGYGSDIIERALMQLLIIPDFDILCLYLDEMYSETLAVSSGENAAYIPELRDANPSFFGASVCTVDTQYWKKGDSSQMFTVQAISWVVTYCAVRELIGAKALSRFVGQEPSGKKSNAFVFDKYKRPHNPFTNLGAIVTASLFHPELTPPRRFNEIMKIWADLVASDVRFDNTTYLSEIEHADRNYSLAYMAKDAGVFDKNVATHGDISRELQFYFQCCSIFVTVEQLSILAATLANGGVNPLSGKKVFSADTVKDCLSLLYSCGMYDYSGQFAFSIGLPAKSAASGIVILVVPGVMGVSLCSPPLDKNGNSVRGLEFAQKFSETFPFHVFDTIGSGSHSAKLNPLKALSKDDSAESARVCYELIFAAANGDLGRLIHLINNSNANVNSSDYDGRTPLHLAVAEKRRVVVEYLLKNGASVNAKDRWGTTPMDEGVKAGNEEILLMLRKSQTNKLVTPSASSSRGVTDHSDSVKQKTEELLSLLLAKERGEGVDVSSLLEQTLTSLKKEREEGERK